MIFCWNFAECKMHNDKDNMQIASDNDQWAKKQIGLKSFKYVKVFAKLKQFGVLVEICYYLIY